jgi:hypothetical protein
MQPRWVSKTPMKHSAAALLLVLLAVACGSAPATTAKPIATLVALATQPQSLTASPTQLVATPTARAVATAVAVEPLAIGDPCLVGRWIMTNLVIADSISFPGMTMSMTGQLGTVMTLGADATEVFDLTNSTRINGVGGGHTMSWLGRGVQRFGFQGQGGQWIESGPPQIATATNVVVDGVSQADFNSETPPFAGSYTCAGSNLTMAIDLPNYSQTATFKK